MLTEEQEIELAIEQIDDDEHVTLNEDGTRTLALSRPIELKTGELVHALNFKPECLVEDIEESEKAGKSAVAQGRGLIAQLTGVPHSRLRKMRSSDFRRASLVVGRISGKEDQETGGTS